jgi:hypothetical protein
VIGTNLFAATAGVGVFRSTNNGTSWTAINTGLTSATVLSLAVSGTNLFAATYGGGVCLSTNNGTSWTDVNAGLTGLGTLDYSLVVSGTNLFAGTYAGVWRRPLSDMVTPTFVEEIKGGDLPVGFALEQNYPNPFNPSTMIEVKIASAGHVSLNVFDLLGHEVGTLMNQILQPGVYKVTWEATGLPSGTYIYRLRANGLVQNKSMILLK